MNKISSDEQKTKVANYAIDYLLEKTLLHSNIKIGLGTGSTAIKAVSRIAELLSEGRIKNVLAVSTSFQTSVLCEELNIPLYSLNSKAIGSELDFTIDGADEIDMDKNLTKGGGAALLQEKILAYNSKSYYIIATENKLVNNLGFSFPIPIEIIPEARKSCIKELSPLASEILLREGVKKMGPVVTDNGNFILDLRLKNAIDVKIAEEKIKLITGVVEVGLFTKKTAQVFLCDEFGTCRSI